MLILLLNQIVSLFLVQLVDAVLVLLQVEPQDGVDVSAHCRVLWGNAVDYLQDDAVDIPADIHALPGLDFVATEIQPDIVIVLLFLLAARITPRWSVEIFFLSLHGLFLYRSEERRV